jgi:hypothetical protein
MDEVILQWECHVNSSPAGDETARSHPASARKRVAARRVEPTTAHAWPAQPPVTGS